MGSRGNLWTGALAGYAASRSTDAATSWFHARQSEASRRREEELAPVALANQGRLPVRREQIPLRSLLESAASLFDSSSLLAGTRIVVDGPERTVDVDPPGARQALVNPLDNALRHTEGGDLAQVQGDRLDSG
ncbi:MAG: hypothetical protein ACXWMG_04105 [Candidatus Limnocylindria bacterium]